MPEMTTEIIEIGGKPIQCPLCDCEVTLPCTCPGTEEKPCGAVLRVMEPAAVTPEQLAQATTHLCELASDQSWLIWSLQRPAAEGEIVAANGIWVSWKHYGPAFEEARAERAVAEP